MSGQLQVKPSQEDIERWIRNFVPGLMLWWWDDTAIPNESLTMRVLDRAGCRSDPLVGDIAYVNAFHTWAMHEDVVRIVVDDGRWIGSLSVAERQYGCRLQVRFNRGLCIQRGRLGNAALPQDAIADGRVVLDQHLWDSLSEAAKRSVIETELPEWDRDSSYRVPTETPGHIASIANTFVQQEGISCLSVTAFAITCERSDLLQWMFPDAFAILLRSYEYADIMSSAVQTGDVIVFRDSEANIVHAAYGLAPDRILNKNGQSSFNPIAIIDLNALEKDWAGYSRSICRG